MDSFRKLKQNSIPRILYSHLLKTRYEITELCCIECRFFILTDLLPSALTE